MLKFIQESLEPNKAIILHPTSLLFQNLITRVYRNICVVNIIGATPGKNFDCRKVFLGDEKTLIHTNSIKVEKKINILLTYLTCLLILALLFHTVLMFFH